MKVHPFFISRFAAKMKIGVTSMLHDKAEVKNKHNCKESVIYYDHVCVLIFFSANLNNKEEIPPDANVDIDHKVHGAEIRQATMLHESVRLTHGKYACNSICLLSAL